MAIFNSTTNWADTVKYVAQNYTERNRHKDSDGNVFRISYSEDTMHRAALTKNPDRIIEILEKEKQFTLDSAEELRTS